MIKSKSQKMVNFLLFQATTNKKNSHPDFLSSDRKRRYKETEAGQKVMCEIMEKIANEERNEGRIEGETRINTLSILINLNRFDDLKRAATDKDFQMQLMVELLPEEM
jgi:hypothetical protein